MSAAGPSCPLCGGDLIADMLGLADSVCLLCSRRFGADLTPAWRSPPVKDSEERRRVEISEASLVKA